MTRRHLRQLRRTSPMVVPYEFTAYDRDGWVRPDVRPPRLAWLLELIRSGAVITLLLPIAVLLVIGVLWIAWILHDQLAAGGVR